MSKKHKQHRVRQDEQRPPEGTPYIGPIGIEPSPDDIFKFRKNRARPANEIWGHGTVTYIPIRAEYIPGKGNFVYYKDVPYPSKTVAPVEAIHAINAIKRIMINITRLLSSKELLLPISTIAFIGRKRRLAILTKCCEYLISIGDMTVLPFYLDDGYYCPVAKELRAFVENTLISFGVDSNIAKKTGEIIGMMFEYDNAYRIRVQDLMNETTKDALLRDFPKELERLLKIQSERETVPNGGQEVVKRFKTIVTLISYAWKIPSMRKSIIQGINSMNLENCKYDEADIYHTLTYGDYNTRGKTQDERWQIYAEIHGPDITKWPPRVMIKSQTA